MLTQDTTTQPGLPNHQTNTTRKEMLDVKHANLLMMVYFELSHICNYLVYISLYTHCLFRKNSKKNVRMTEQVAYCKNQTECRRVSILNYLGEHFDPKLCSYQCDICSNHICCVEKDVSKTAKQLVSWRFPHGWHTYYSNPKNYLTHNWCNFVTTFTDGTSFGYRAVLLSQSHYWRVQRQHKYKGTFGVHVLINFPVSFTRNHLLLYIIYIEP
jgi:hypothetical protein